MKKCVNSSHCIKRVLIYEKNNVINANIAGYYQGLNISRSKINLVWNDSKQPPIKDRESFVHEIENLKQSEGKNISVESGVKTWQLFLQNSLFDELWLLVHPVVASQGEKLFTDVGTKFSLQLINSKIYKNGVVGLRYQKM